MRDPSKQCNSSSAADNPSRISRSSDLAPSDYPKEALSKDPISSIVAPFPVQDELQESLKADTEPPRISNMQKLLEEKCGPKTRCILGRHAIQRRMAQECLAIKYMTKQEVYNAKVVNDIIYNESTHIVSLFKDYLIFDDISEFLKRYYAGFESTKRLPKVFQFYDKYSKVFPNYISLPENKFMFKNIERKQRLIDEQQKNQEKKDDIKDDDTNNKLLSSHFMKELNDPAEPTSTKLKVEEDSLDKDPQRSTLMKSYMKSLIKNPTKKHNLEEMGIHELLDQFVSKDSISIPNITAKTFDFEYSVTTDQSKPQPPRKLPDPLPQLHTKLIQIRSSSEAVTPAPVPMQKSNSKLPLKDISPTVERCDESPLTAPVKKPDSSRNQAPIVPRAHRTVRQADIPRVPSEVYLRSVSSGTFVKPPSSTKYDGRSGKVSLRSQSNGKKETLETLKIKTTGKMHDKKLPSLDSSPMMKKEVISQKYNLTNKRKRSIQQTDGTKATSKDEPASKGTDFCYYINALKDPWAVQQPNTKKPGPPPGNSSPGTRPSHRKTVSTDVNIGKIGPQQLTIQLKGRNQKALGVDIGNTKTIATTEVITSKVSKTVKHAEQVYLQQPQVKFKSEYLNNLKSKQSQIKTAQKPQKKNCYFQSAQKEITNVYCQNGGDLLSKQMLRSESQRGLSTGMATLPLSFGKPVKIVRSGYGVVYGGKYTGGIKR